MWQRKQVARVGAQLLATQSWGAGGAGKQSPAGDRREGCLGWCAQDMQGVGVGRSGMEGEGFR